ncbi:MAG: hypothetical protein FIA95_00350 [Gemmatimonadetes bacterium]|nr:hypothetical protein [Gemmatimonadota bacterium]
MSLRNVSSVVVCVATLLVATATAASAAYILSIPGFESGDLSGWQVFGIGGSSYVTVMSPDNGPSAPGTRHAFMDNRAPGLGLTLKQTTAPGTATGGVVFYSFDLKLVRAELGGVFFVQVFAEKTGAGIVGSSGLLGNYAAAGWNTYQGSFVAPAGTDFLSIQFMANTGANIGSVSQMLVDNVSLDQGTTPAPPSTWGRVKSLYR